MASYRSALMANSVDGLVAPSTHVSRRTKSSTPANLVTRVWFVAWLALAAPAVIIGSVVWLRFEQAPDWFIPLIGVWLAQSPLTSFVLAKLTCQKPLRDIQQLDRALKRLAGKDFETAVSNEVIGDLRPMVRHLSQIGELLAEFEMAKVREQYGAETKLSQHRGEVEQLLFDNSRLQREAEILKEFAGYISRDLSAAQICGKLIATLENKIQYSIIQVFLCEKEPCDQLVPAAIHDQDRNVRLVGDYIRELSAIRVPDLSRRSVFGWSLQTKKPLTLRDAASETWIEGFHAGMRSQMVVPMQATGGLAGILALGAAEPGAYSKSDERLVSSLAGLAAVAIHNVRLNAEAAKVEALRTLDRLKSELLSTVSHELRTPLASIKGYSTTLLRRDVEWTRDDQIEFLSIIDEEADRLNTMIDDLLQMSEIEAGILKIRRRSTNIGKLTQKVVKRVKARAQSHNINCQVAPNLRETNVDARRLEQVMHNLVENAVKYSPEGGEIEVRVDQEDSRIRFSVADQGIGIALEDQGRVFDRFYRVEGSLARETGGSGLGLAICRGIVEAHGGKIWVESAPGAGSVFTFAVPVTSSEDDDTTNVELEVDE